MGVLPQQHAITDALGDMRDGIPGALDRLIPLVYGDLAGTRLQWNTRAHFLAVAAHVMPRVLIDHARRHRAARRGGLQRRRIPLEQPESTGDEGLTATERTAARDWVKARGWLYQELSDVDA